MKTNGNIKVKNILEYLTLLFSGWAFCLPVPFSEDVEVLYPWWAKRIGIGNIQLYELLFILWIIIYGRKFFLQKLLEKGFPTRQAALWLIVLALWCGLMSLAAPLPWIDIGRTSRLLLMAVLLVCVVHWTRQKGISVLGTQILGLLVGTIINLIISFQYPAIINGTMRLSGQNTPGVFMGIAIHLCAWLFQSAYDFRLRVFAVVATIVFAFGCAISYSRVGWFAGAMGFAAWVYILFFSKRSSKKIGSVLGRIMAGILIIIFSAGLFYTPSGREIYLWIKTLGYQKFTNEMKNESDEIRLSYGIGTAQILLKNPLGVGYSGFYNAMTTTDIYRNGKAGEENNPYEANPHASFLWYATAGGIPGGFLALLVFVLLLKSLRIGMVGSMGKEGLVLYALITLPYILIGGTVPYIFNSCIMIFPVAIAAGLGWSNRARHITKIGNPDVRWYNSRQSRSESIYA